MDKSKDLENKIAQLEAKVREEEIYARNLEQQIDNLAEKFALCQSIVQNVPEPLFIVDRDLVVNYINQPALELLGYLNEGISYSMKAPEIFLPVGMNPEEYPLTKCMETGIPQINRKVSFRNKNGKAFYLAISVAPLRTALGKIKGAFMIMRDITLDIEMSEKEKAQLKSEAESQIIQMEKMASLGVLAAGIAHEINNPLGFLISNLDTLKTCVQGLQGTQTLGDTKLTLGDLKAITVESLEGALRIKRIVSDLRTFSRRSESQRATIDINQVLDSVLSIVWNEIKYKVTVIKDYRVTTSISADPTQLSQVFLNIIINANQAMADRGTVTLSTYEDKDSVYVKISDSGCGMSADTLSRIFDPFFSTKKSTGLGLSVSYNIIKHHEGDIKVESEPGKGTTFIVQLPKFSKGGG